VWIPNTWKYLHFLRCFVHSLYIYCLAYAAVVVLIYVFHNLNIKKGHNCNKMLCCFMKLKFELMSHVVVTSSVVSVVCEMEGGLNLRGG
jgi:hypothetical protein